MEADKKAQDNIAKNNAEAVRRRDATPVQTISEADYNASKKKVLEEQEDEAEEPNSKYEYNPSDEDIQSIMGLFNESKFSPAIMSIANSLELADDDLVNKVRKYILQITHEDKVGSKYSESYKTLTGEN